MPVIPKLDENNSNFIKTSSKFIDIDTHNVVDGFNLYEKKEKAKDNKLINIEKARGIEVEGDFMLGSYKGYDYDDVNMISYDFI